MKKFIVLGYPRSGTSYTAAAFHKIGLYVTHERDEAAVKILTGRVKEADGVVTGLFMNCDRNIMKYPVRFHQVRHPLKVISSAMRMSFRSMMDLLRTCGIKKTGLPKDKLYRVMKTWLVFTEKVDLVCHKRFRVEDLYPRWNEILMDIGLKYTAPFPKRLPTYCNTFTHKPVEYLRWDQLIAVDEEMGWSIKKKAEEYGYTDKISDAW